MNRTKKILMLIVSLIMLASALALSASAASAPAAPKSVTTKQTTSSITLSWPKVSGATGYRIYYKLPADLSWRTAVSTMTATSKTFSKLPSAQRYTFAVRSYTKTSTGTVWGGYKQLETATQPTAPKKLTAAQTTSAIQLNWSEVSGATGYRIYYRPTSTATWKTAVSTTDDNTHTFPKLASAKKYDFAVRPYIKTSAGVVWGNYKEIGTATKPDAPKNLNSDVNVFGKSVTLSWDKVTRADGYRIYQREQGEEAWRVAVSFTDTTNHTFNKVADGAWEFAVLALVKTTSGNITGSYRWKSWNMYSPTTAPAQTSVWYSDITTVWYPNDTTTTWTTTAWYPNDTTTTVATTTAVVATGIYVSINDAFTDTQGRICVAINPSGWDGKIKSNSQRVPVYVDGVELEGGAMLQISSSTDGNGYQYIVLNLGRYEINTDSSTVSFTIPEGFLENKTGTKYNYAYEVVF